ncbi:hypothetical protein AAEO56_00420 [Flavobacterium sp. DGU11]|uniref:Uncharacterized protein n=1 Tax=Flavobacterium arundinis TaxID=3139143 RepID=A0ABU9HT21_9FLAO
MIQQLRTRADKAGTIKPKAGFQVAAGKHTKVIFKIAVISVAALLIINVLIFSADLLTMLVLTHRE